MRAVQRIKIVHHRAMHVVRQPHVHRHVFRYAVSVHFLDAAVQAGHLVSFDAVVALAATLGTLALHITEEERE